MHYAIVTVLKPEEMKASKDVTVFDPYIFDSSASRGRSVTNLLLHSYLSYLIRQFVLPVCV